MPLSCYRYNLNQVKEKIIKIKINQVKNWPASVIVVKVAPASLSMRTNGKQAIEDGFQANSHSELCISMSSIVSQPQTAMMGLSNSQLTSKHVVKGKKGLLQCLGDSLASKGLSGKNAPVSKDCPCPCL